MKTQRNNQIESLRGVAILCVMVFHFFGRFGASFKTQGFLSLPLVEYFGVIGTTIFFLITGYFAEINADKGYQKHYLFWKISRLWPVYFVSITICFIATRFFELPNKTVTFVQYLLNIPFINGFIDKPYVDGAHWYLTTMLGALICYSIILRFNFKIRRILYFVWLCTYFGLLGLHHFFSGNILLELPWHIIGGQQAPVIVCGSALAIFIQSKEKLKNSILLICCVGLSFVGVGVSTGVVLLIDGVIFVLALKSKLSFLSIAPFQYLGKISYSIYAIHQNLGYIVMLIITNKIFDGRYNLLTPTVAIILFVGIGTAMYYIVEKPAKDYLKKLKKKRTA